MIESLLFAIYLLLLLFLSLYSFHAYSILFYYLRLHRKRLLGEGSNPQFSGPHYPFVTIQLPIYNEKYVVARLINSVINIDYPKERYEIQILDDSTDETTFILSNLVEKYSSLGYNITLHHREDRKGFKAGALAEGMNSARGEFIAIFDSDFIVPPDFLKRTLPYFYNSPSSVKVAAVQTRWGHLNRDYSILTQGQALALDEHFLFEQDIKCRKGLFINFNGTCGIWRREAIEKAGGWHDDTLTEDLDLSYRVQLQGYKILFIPDLVCPGELPVDVNGFKKQQFRWTKGGIEVAKKIIPSVIRSRLPWRVKFYSFTHLTSPFVYPILLSLSLLSFPILYTKIRYCEITSLYSPDYLLAQSRAVNLYFILLSLFTIFVIPFPILYILSYYRTRQLDGKRDEKRINWVIIAFLLIGGFVSLSIFNTLAIIQALLGKKTEFSRTPKFSIVGKEGNLRNKKYVDSLSPVTFLEMGMGFYLLLTIIYSLIHFELGLVPFLFLYTLGFFFLSFSSIRQEKECRHTIPKGFREQMTDGS